MHAKEEHLPKTRPRIAKAKPEPRASLLSPGALEVAIRDALAVHRELHPRDLPTYGDVRDERPCKDLALAVALEACKGAPSSAVLPKLHAKILAAPEDERAFVGRFLGHATQKLAALHAHHGAAIWPPRDNLQTLLPGTPADWAELRAECRDFECEPRLLVALAVWLTPEACFGRVTRSPQEQALLEERYEEACAPIATLWTRADTQWVLEDEQRGRGRMVFARWPEVDVYPLHDCGKRLVDWIASHAKGNGR